MRHDPSAVDFYPYFGVRMRAEPTQDPSFQSEVIVALLDKIGASSTGAGDTTKRHQIPRDDVSHGVVTRDLADLRPLMSLPRSRGTSF